MDDDNDNDLPLYAPNIQFPATHQQDLPNGFVPAMVTLVAMTGLIVFLIIKNQSLSEDAGDP